MTRITSHWIRVLGLTIGSVAFALIAGLPSPVARAAPTVPASFYGNVTVAGSPAVGGLVIEARIDGVDYAFAPETPNSPPTTASDGTYGRGTNVFQVLADDPSTGSKEGGVPGDTISFIVGGSAANSATFAAGATELNLSVTSASLPTPTPVPGPPPPAPPPPPIIFPTPTPVLEPTPIPVDEVEDAPIDDAVGIIEGATTEDAAAVFEELTVEKAAAITEALSPEMAAAIVELLTTETATAIIEEVETTKAAAIIELLLTETAASIFEALGTDVAVDLIEALTVATAAAILDLVPLAKASDIVGSVEAGHAADILSEMSPQTAASILERVSVTILTEVVQLIAEAKLVELLSQISPQKLFQVPAEVLFRTMPSVPIEHLASEVPPRADSALPLPQIIDITDSLATYNVPKTRAGAWVTLVQDRAPFDHILGKFSKDLSDVGVSLEDLSKSGEGLPDLGSGRIVGPYFRVEIGNASPEDITVAHVTIFVEKEWIQSNGLHPWSIEFNRFDDGLNVWVPFPSKRIREDSTRAYYSVAVPGFSVLAVSGSESLPEEVFKVSNLAVIPSAPLSDEPFTVSVGVTNTGTSLATYPGSVWLDGTVEAAQAIALEAGESRRVEFTLAKSTGVYQIRVDRSLANLIVGSPAPTAIPVPVPTAVSPTATPVPTVEPTAIAIPTAAPPPPPPATPTATATAPPPEPEPLVSPVPTSEPAPAPAATTTSAPVPVETLATTTAEDSGGGGPPLAAIILAVLAGIGGIGFAVYMITVRRRMERGF